MRKLLATLTMIVVGSCSYMPVPACEPEPVQPPPPVVCIGDVCGWSA